MRTTKKALKTVLETHTPTDEEFHTALYKVAAYINNYPISYTRRSEAELDIEPLTPAHFIRGKGMRDLAGSKFEASSYTNRYTSVNKSLDLFWKRLVRELSPHLRTYSKWSNIQRDLCKNDIGVYLNENIRNKFPLVIITKVYPSADGKIRRLEVFDGKKTFKASIGNFSLLISEEKSNNGISIRGSETKTESEISETRTDST